MCSSAKKVSNVNVKNVIQELYILRYSPQNWGRQKNADLNLTQVGTSRHLSALNSSVLSLLYKTRI